MQHLPMDFRPLICILFLIEFAETQLCLGQAILGDLGA